MRFLNILNSFFLSCILLVGCGNNNRNENLIIIENSVDIYKIDLHLFVCKDSVMFKKIIEQNNYKLMPYDTPYICIMNNYEFNLLYSMLSTYEWKEIPNMDTVTILPTVRADFYNIQGKAFDAHYLVEEFNDLMLDYESKLKQPLSIGATKFVKELRAKRFIFREDNKGRGVKEGNAPK